MDQNRTPHKKRDAAFFFTLFRSTFLLSAFTFGGGFVIIPLMKKRFVDELQWIDEGEMLDLTAIAQSSPGAIAVNASILVGYRMAGLSGALVTILGTILPPLIILSVISVFYTAFRNSAAVMAVLNAMKAGVAAVIVDVVINMGGGIIKTRSLLSILVMFCAFAAVYFFQVNVIFIILACGAIGIGSAVYHEKKGEGQ